MTRLVNSLGSLVFAGCLLLLLAALLAPALFDVSLDVVLSGSMEPALAVGGLIGIRPVDPSEVRVGDVVGFRLDGERTPVCHRVLEIVRTEEGTGFRTKGDALEQPDRWVVEPDDLVGKVVFHVPVLGYLASFVKTKTGLLMVMGLPALGVVALQTREFLRPEQAVLASARCSRSDGLTPAHLCALAGVIVVACAWRAMAGNVQGQRLNSFAIRESAQTGSPVVARRRLHNPGPFPLIVCMKAPGSAVSFSQRCVSLGPAEQKQIEIRSASKDALILSGGFLPLLPAPILDRLFTWDHRLAPMLAALIPGLPIVLLTFTLLGGFARSRSHRRKRARLLRRLHRA